MTNPLLDALRPRPTGGLIVTFRDGLDHEAQEECLHDCVGASARSFSTATEDMADVDPGTAAVLLDDSGIAVVFEREDIAATRDRLTADEKVKEVRPEFWMFALDQFEDSQAATWGLEATGAASSPLTGAGIRLCILDTGIDLQHPDFTGRAITGRSFVPGEEVQDGNGHGTHCAGTAAGSLPRGNGPRYGVAPDAGLHIGKVLNNQGSGRERDGVDPGIANPAERLVQTLVGQVPGVGVDALVHGSGRPRAVPQRTADHDVAHLEPALAGDVLAHDVDVRRS
ncbi:MAG: S8 family serine peptidase, partial [Tabrizicola sp.]|nr:S8 family serine peptidase [Tabrizicola sp.]